MSKLPQCPYCKAGHASIETTLAYYVGENAKETSKSLWRAIGNTEGNTAHNPTTSAPPVSDVTSYTVTTSARSSVG